jgi:hypothetical protein
MPGWHLQTEQDCLIPNLYLSIIHDRLFMSFGAVEFKQRSKIIYKPECRMTRHMNKLRTKWQRIIAASFNILQNYLLGETEKTKKLSFRTAGQQIEILNRDDQNIKQDIRLQPAASYVLTEVSRI